AVADRAADGVSVVDVGAVDEVAIAEVELVGAERVGDLALGAVQRRNEDLAVEDDLHAGREGPEVAVTVDAADLVAADLDEGAVREADALAGFELDGLQAAAG